VGYQENVRFFRLDYLSHDEVELGRHYAEIAPLLWLASGARGSWELESQGQAWFIPSGAAYAVLFDVTQLPAFRRALDACPDVQRVFIVTDSEVAFTEAHEFLGGERWRPTMLYRDYLNGFQGVET
jgi:hypothetical protein